MGKGTQQTTSTTKPTGKVMQRYNNLISRANQLSKTDFKKYKNDFTAPVNSTMQSAVNQLNSPNYAYQPYYDQASALINKANGPNPYYQQAQDYLTQSTADVNPMAFSQEALNQYLSPYQQQVIDATMASIAEDERRQQQDVIGNRVLRGAFGGDRSAVAQAELARTSGISRNQTLAELNNQNYAQALGMFNTQQGVDLNAQLANRAAEANAAGQYAGLGNSYANTALQGAGALTGMGTSAEQARQQNLGQQFQAGLALQDIAQAEKDAKYQQFLNKQAYPFQSLQFYSNILQGSTPSMGSQTTTESPAPNWLSGLVGSGLGLFNTFRNPTGAKRGGAITRDRGEYVPHDPTRRRGYAAGGLPLPYTNEDERIQGPYTPIDPTKIPDFKGPKVANPLDAINPFEDTAPKIDVGQKPAVTPPGVTEYADTGAVPAVDPARGKNDDLWQYLGDLGFGMAAGDSPYFFQNVGMGGLAANKSAADRRAAAAEAARFAAEQAQQDKQFGMTFGLQSQQARAEEAWRTADIRVKERQAEIDAQELAAKVKWGFTDDERAYNQINAQRAELGQPPLSREEWEIMKRRAATPTAESELDKGLGKTAAEEQASARQSGIKSYARLHDLDNLETVLAQGTQGKFAGTEAEVVAWMQAAGMSPDQIKAFGLNPGQAAAYEAAQSYVNQMALQKIGTEGSQEGIPANNFSERDLMFLQQTVPNLANRPEANRIIIEAKRRYEQINQAFYNEWVQYKKLHGNSVESWDTFTSDFYTRLASENHFDDLLNEALKMGATEPAPAPAAATPTVTSVAPAPTDDLPPGAVLE